jgi:uncharacterized protein (TIRG00374 family)
MPNHRRTALRLLVGSALTVIFLWLFVREVDFVGALRGMSAAPAWALAAAAALFLPSIVLAAVRWRALLGRTERPLRFRRLLSAVCGGRATNNLLPVRGGDQIRIGAMRDAGHVPSFVVIGTLFAERLLDGLVIAALVVLGAVSVGESGVILLTGIALAFGAIVGGILVALAARNPDGTEQTVWRAARRLRPRWHTRVARATAHFVEGLAAFRSRRRLTVVIAATVGMWLAEAGMYAVVGRGFGLGVGVGGTFLLAGIGSLALAVPATAAGLGTFEFFMLAAAKAIDVPTAQAASYVFVMHALVVVPPTVSGALLASPALRRALSSQETVALEEQSA